jgi:hypothetical protein
LKNQSDVIKIFKWREIDETRNVQKVKRVVELCKKKIAKGKIYLEIELFGKQIDFRFYKFKSSSFPRSYRSIYIIKDIDAEAGKSSELVDEIIKKIGKVSYCRSILELNILKIAELKCYTLILLKKKFQMMKRRKQIKSTKRNVSFMK